jgi:hypothetical protein
MHEQKYLPSLTQSSSSRLQAPSLSSGLTKNHSRHEQILNPSTFQNTVPRLELGVSTVSITQHDLRARTAIPHSYVDTKYNTVQSQSHSSTYEQELRHLIPTSTLSTTLPIDLHGRPPTPTHPTPTHKVLKKSVEKLRFQGIGSPTT